MSRVRSRRPKYLGEKLKQIRDFWRESSLTQYEASVLVRKILKEVYKQEYPELNREYISGYERGSRTVPPVVLLAYAHLANVFVEVLIDDLLIIEPGEKFPFAERYAGRHR